MKWLDSIKHDAEAVFLLGDLFDLWFEYKYVVPKGFTRVLGKRAELSDQGIKIHLLHIMKQTKLGKIYLEKPFKMLTLDEYKDIVCDQLEILDPNIIVHRLTGDSPRELLIAPLWSLKKLVVMNEIDKELRKRDTYQGSKFKK